MSVPVGELCGSLFGSIITHAGLVWLTDMESFQWHESSTRTQYGVLTVSRDILLKKIRLVNTSRIHLV